MKKNIKTFNFSLILFLYSFITNAQAYKATYKITYISNLTNSSVRTESGLLIIKANEGSVYATKNYFKQDSILRLVNAGTISKYDVMNDSYPRTSFKNHIQKTYNNQMMVVPTQIIANTYVYSQKNSLNWQLLPDTSTIKGYKCVKATTTFEGRDYVAWYSTDIPISDGPHKFWGLPGLIIKIADTKNHYTFELESFEKFANNFPKFERSDPTFEITYEKFKQLRKDENENPLKVFQSQGFYPVGESISKPLNRNIIERF